MRTLLNRQRISARVVIGERLGSGGTELDVAVDPVEGTDAVAAGRAGGLAVIAVSERGGLMGAPDMYMQKLVVGTTAAGHVHLNGPVAATLAHHHRLRLADLGIALRDRPRHAALVAEIRRAGARVHLTQAGDVIPALEVTLGGYGVHALMGIGGAPEGIVTAAAQRGIGGEIQGRFKATNNAPTRRVFVAWSGLGAGVHHPRFRPGLTRWFRGDRDHGVRGAERHRGVWTETRVAQPIAAAPSTV